MKVFISQPMKGKSDEVVLAERKLIIERIKKLYGEDVEIIDSFFDDFKDSDSKRPEVVYLAKAIEVLAEADLAFFSTGWTRTKGCRIEYDVARAYGIKIDGDTY